MPEPWGDRYEEVVGLTRQRHARAVRLRDTGLGPSVLAVCLDPRADVDEAERQRLAEAFRAELGAVAGIGDARVLPVKEFAAEMPLPFAVLEDPARPSVADAGAPSLTPAEAAVWMRDLVEVLALLTAGGLRFTAVPADFLFTTDEARLRWGHLGMGFLAEAPTQEAAIERPVRPAYTSPEELAGEAVDERALVFSLGTLLYELLSARRAFQAETPDDALHLMRTRVPEALWNTRRDLPADLVDLVHRSLSDKPDERPPTVAAFREELVAGAEALGVPAPPAPEAMPVAPVLIPVAVEEAAEGEVEPEEAEVVEIAAAADLQPEEATAPEEDLAPDSFVEAPVEPAAEEAEPEEHAAEAAPAEPPPAEPSSVQPEWVPLEAAGAPAWGRVAWIAGGTAAAVLVIALLVWGAHSLLSRPPTEPTAVALTEPAMPMPSPETTADTAPAPETPAEASAAPAPTEPEPEPASAPPTVAAAAASPTVPETSPTRRAATRPAPAPTDWSHSPVAVAPPAARTAGARSATRSLYRVPGVAPSTSRPRVIPRYARGVSTARPRRSLARVPGVVRSAAPVRVIPRYARRSSAVARTQARTYHKPRFSKSGAQSPIQAQVAW